MNRGLFGNREQDKYISGEVIKSYDSPGSGWIAFDGVANKQYQRGVDKNFAYKAGKLFKNFVNLGATTPASNFYRKIEYGNGQWVLLSNGNATGLIQTSTDLVTWTTRTSNLNNANGLAFGNGVFVAGNANTTFHLVNSTDGITWATQTIAGAASPNLMEISFGNGIFAACDAVGGIYTSTDGATWSIRTSNTSNQLYRIRYGNGTWVAAGLNGTIISSTDATTWTARTSNFGSTAVRGLAYGNGVWLASGYGGSIRSSTDGTTWVTRTSPTVGGALLGLAYGNGTFVISATNEPTWASTDLVSWTTQTFTFVGAGPKYNDFINGRFFIGDASTTVSNIYTATNGYKFPSVTGLWVKS